MGRFIQAKLEVNQPGDMYEQEADRVAEQVMRMPESTVVSGQLPGVRREDGHIQRMCAACASGKSLCPECAEEEETVQRKPLAGQMMPIIRRQALEESEEEKETLRAKDSPGRTPDVSPSVESHINSIRGGGQFLPESVRSFFEPQFGYDFSGVRLHTDAQAVKSARAVNALAYTMGRDIVFGAGEYAPNTNEGRSLLAHELAHVVQQNGTTHAKPQRRAVPFNPDSIAQQLYEAMKGWGTDEESIYAALSGRSQSQIDEISAAYQRPTGHSLRADLEDELTSDELLRLASFSPGPADSIEKRADMVAGQLRNAMEGLGTDETAIYSALNGRTPEELTAIKAAYKRLTRRELLDDLQDELSGDELQRALGQMDVAPTVYEQNTELEGLSMGNFDFHFKNCAVLIWVWVKYQFTNDINPAEQTNFKSRFVNAIHLKWAHSGYSLSGSGSCPCSSVPIEVHVEENAGGFYHKLVDVERKTDMERRPKVISDINVNLFTDNGTLAHEFGHVLGLYDEYDGGVFENIMFWHRNQPGDPSALMNIGTELRPRYFEHYRQRVQATAPPGCEYQISSPVPPVT